MASNNAPRLLLLAFPPLSVRAALAERLIALGVTEKLGNRLLRFELLHQSFSGRLLNPSNEQCDALIHACAGISAHACTLRFNRVEGPNVEAGRTHCTLLPRGKPKAFAETHASVSRHLRASGFEAMATGNTPHMTLSYNALTSFANIPIVPTIDWTIDELCLAIGGGNPYRYEVIGRWPLLPELAAPTVQPALF
ncbi:hypothetical protein [Chiayiivirga flava]|uniref:2'-5' RNA ligase n=1 Tax=Chiayiivirga flava TaxID=659595 RepID=A0A7W8D6J5_9GAMM|nr:hypothetical protein [Chiayiivirga flava]MBB5207198.1 hypothetical protein [Chiayiivirga flava]